MNNVINKNASHDIISEALSFNSTALIGFTGLHNKFLLIGYLSKTALKSHSPLLAQHQRANRHSQ